MKKIDEYLAENKALMLEVLGNLISYPSVYAQDNAAYPFGEANAKCLDYALQVCEDFGMKTKNLDYYVGYGEIGQGEKLLGIIGHLDVVPVGSNWNTDPFKMEIIDGKIFGRGTSDDKGPMVSALFAVKYLIDNNIEFKKRLRLVFGCNEESGFACAKHYVEKEGHFDMGFTPDGPFPCCFGEKGIIKFEMSTENKLFDKLNGGVAANVVPDHCELTIDSAKVDKAALVKYLEESPVSEHSLTEEDGKLTLIVKGKAAHASTPEEGINAIAYALSALHVAGVEDEAISEFYERFNTEIHGDSCGIHFKDKYGDLTLNIGMISLVDDKIVFVIDIRNPFTIPNKEAIDIMNQNFKHWQVVTLTDDTGLYQPEDSPFVTLLTNTYNEITGSDKKAIAMGGGTYARGIHNTLAFGVDDGDGENTNIHDANEFVREEKLLRNTNIFIQALLRMMEL